MDKHNIEKMEYRVGELEKLIWSIFRALETCVILNALPPEAKNCKHSKE